MMLGFTLSDYTPHVVDPAVHDLARELRLAHSRLELLAATLDPRTTPQGVADAVHDALAAITEGRDLAAALDFGANG